MIVMLSKIDMELVKLDNAVFPLHFSVKTGTRAGIGAKITSVNTCLTSREKGV